MTNDADRIAAAGRTVTFADGEHTLVFGFLGMKMLEEEMDGLLGALEAFGFQVDDESELTPDERVAKAKARKKHQWPSCSQRSPRPSPVASPMSS